MHERIGVRPAGRSCLHQSSYYAALLGTDQCPIGNKTIAAILLRRNNRPRCHSRVTFRSGRTIPGPIAPVQVPARVAQLRRSVTKQARIVDRARLAIGALAGETAAGFVGYPIRSLCHNDEFVSVPPKDWLGAGFSFAAIYGVVPRSNLGDGRQQFDRRGTWTVQYRVRGQ
jgi:hypothetical protein